MKAPTPMQVKAQAQTQAMPAAPAAHEVLGAIGRAAVVALYDELSLPAKPGLVSLADSGSHDDMDARTFMRSLFALRHGYARFVQLGHEGAPFEALQAAGRAAEAQMLQATGGINTHRGAIFTLGLLCAAAGALVACGEALRASALRRALQANWGVALQARDAQARDSHGWRAAQRFGLRGANREAADGFPVLFDVTLPALRAALQGGPACANVCAHVCANAEPARRRALFETIAMLPDTNLAHRGGLAGLRHAQAAARDWLRHDAGAVQSHDQAGDPALDHPIHHQLDPPLAHALRLHRDFVARRLSPGGSADLLAAACFVQRICHDDTAAGGGR